MIAEALKESRVDSSREYLTFTLGSESYGVDILKVKEIRGWEKLRELHDTPVFVKGVLDLRGSIVPIVDLRLRFRLSKVEYHPTTVIIVISIDDKDNMMGVVVDSVSDVLTVKQDEVKSSPSLGSKINTEYVIGMVSKQDHMVMLLDTEKLLDTEDFDALIHAQQENQV